MPRGIIQMDTVFTAATTTLYTKEGMESIHEHLLSAKCVYIWSMADIRATQSQGQELSCNAVKQKKNDGQNHEKPFPRCQFQSMNVIGHASIPASVGNLKCRRTLIPFLPVLRVRY